MRHSIYLAVRAIRLGILMALAVACLLPAATFAQFKPEDEKAGGIKFDKEMVQRIRIGMKVKAVGGPCVGVYGTAPFPIDWPEQKVRVVDEEYSAAVKRKPNRTVDGTVQQMVVTIPQLKSGEEAIALVTLEVHRRIILPPDDTTVFSIPTKEQLDADLKKYLMPSPKIESTTKVIKDLSKEILDGAKDKTAWEQVEAIYDWVRENVEYQNQPLKGALAALKDKNGDCEELTSLFIALCRAGNIPARTVWVPGHCYPEFYLVDRSGQGHWFPCQAAGTRAFGGIPEYRPILQKGDSFKDIDRPREKMRYLSEFLTGKSIKNGGRPKVTFIREDVATDKPLDDTATDISPIQPSEEESKNQPGTLPPADMPEEKPEPMEEAKPILPGQVPPGAGRPRIDPRIDPRNPRVPQLPPGVGPGNRPGGKNVPQVPRRPG